MSGVVPKQSLGIREAIVQTVLGMVWCGSRRHERDLQFAR